VYRYLRVKNGRVYAAVGSPCNTCLKDQKVFGIMTSWNKTDGSDYKLHATGIRNTVGFDFHPTNANQMWFTENGRDEWGNDRPHDELNVLDLAASGNVPHFGFPFCYERNLSDPEYFTGNCLNGKYVPAKYLLAPHAAAIGMTFYSGSMFPSKYSNGNVIFIAEHGSWNRDTPIAYRVTMVDTTNPDSYQVFIDGWLQLPKEGSNDSEYAWGRPADVLQMRDGSLFISDDKSGTVYRVKYN